MSTPSSFESSLSSSSWSSNMLAVSALMTVVALVLASYLVMRLFGGPRLSGGKQSVVILGERGSGKTALFYQLQQGIFRETHTSMREVQGVFIPVQAAQDTLFPRLTWVCYPGHSTLRSGAARYYQHAKILIYVIDGSDMECIQSSSLFLYSLLSDGSLQKRRPHLLLCVNKSDSSDYHPVDEVIRPLEKLIDKKRELRSTMQDVAGAETQEATLGIPAKEFRFEDSQIPVTIVQTSAMNSEGVQPIVDFVRKHA